MTGKKILKEVKDWAIVIGVAVLISLFINFFVIVNATVPSSSMERTIMTNDRVIGLRFSYYFEEPDRGDIVIFHFPDNEDILYIKRIIGLPGEKVEIKDGEVYIDGVALEEPYIAEKTRECGTKEIYEVPEGHYFMMGDNRNNSSDSRYWNNTYLAKDKIIGKAVLRYWPGIKLLK
ncbi:MAG: signal peptidase I [Lachnospiraceae bacterium]|nr:signal peptidase I [Lachnospiraceae bacterium]